MLRSGFLRALLAAPAALIALPEPALVEIGRAVVKAAPVTTVGPAITASEFELLLRPNLDKIWHTEFAPNHYESIFERKM